MAAQLVLHALLRWARVVVPVAVVVDSREERAEGLRGRTELLAMTIGGISPVGRGDGQAIGVFESFHLSPSMTV